MKIALVDYGSGNLRSAAKSFERAAVEASLNAHIDVTADPSHVLAADRVVLPGVGAFGDCREGIRAIDGMWDALEEVVIEKRRPFLGICVGMQLMADKGLEHGDHDGFGWIAGQVVSIKTGNPDLKIPHMGWNTLDVVSDHPVFQGIESGAHAYFVHSYHFQVSDDKMRLAKVTYGRDITAAVGRDNMVGTQFHPEKSQRTGLTLIRNFLEWQL